MDKYEPGWVIKKAAAGVIGNVSSLSGMPPYLITILLPAQFLLNNSISILGKTNFKTPLPA